MKYSTSYMVAVVVFGTVFAVLPCVVSAQVDQDIYCHSGQYCSFDNPDTSEGLFRQNPSDGYIWFIPYPTLYTTPTSPTIPSATTTPTPPTTTPQQQPQQTLPPTPPTQNPPNTTNTTPQTPPQPPAQTPAQTLGSGNNLYYTPLFYMPGSLGTSTSTSIPLLLSTFFPTLAPAGLATNESLRGMENTSIAGGTPLPGDRAYLGESAEDAYEYYTEEETVEVVTIHTPGSPAATTTQKRKVLRRRLVIPKKQHGLFDDPLVLGALGITILALGAAAGYTGYKRYYSFDDEDTKDANDSSRDTFS